MSLSQVAESERLAALRSYRILDTPSDPIFDHITDLAAHVFDVPFACVSLVDEHRVWLKSAHGLDVTEIEREPGLCATAIESDGITHRRDASLDPVGASNSVVRGGVRFYAGCALRTPQGMNLGTICVMGTEPRDLADSERATLENLARLAMSEVERHRATTELAQARDALRASDLDYQTLAELAPVGIFRTDAAGDGVYVNERWCEIAGLEPGQAAGRGWTEGLHPDDRARITDDWYRCVARGGAFEAEFRFLRDDGAVTRVLGRAVPERNGSENVTGWVGTITDVTLQHDLEEHMQETQKLESLGLLAGGIAHDFNNLLTSVMGNANLALGSLSPDSEPATYLRNIDHATQRAADLCSQLLAYAGKGRIRVSVLDLNELVREMGDLLDVSVSKKAVLDFQLAERLPAIEGDVTQIRQVVMNLITNASDALGDNTGSIVLTTGTMRGDGSTKKSVFAGAAPADDFVFFNVSDDGCGLSAETRNKVFDPFFTTKFSGHGLGMAAALGIVRGHGGAIRIESEVDRGTTVRVLLPASLRAPEPAEPGREPGPEWKGRGTILFVDDEEMVCQLAASTLQKAGFEVHLASDGLEALEIIDGIGDEISAVVLDMIMPNFDGTETFAKLRERRPDLPVILSSGYAAAGPSQASVPFLKKPYRPRDLVDLVRQVVEA